MNRFELRRRHWIGLLTGAVGGLAAGILWPEWRETVGLTGAILWGAAIGAMLASLPQFAVAGKVITRSENEALNLLVGVGIPAAVLIGLALLLNWYKGR